MMLANVGSDVLSQLERFKESFLWAAAKGGRVEECESLVQMGTDVNWISPEGDTPLLAACRNGHAPVALCLLSHGASVNQAANDGQTALHLSVRHGNEAVAEALILGGADVFARDNGGATALESEGPHIPDGMLQRLNVIAQRTGRRNHHDGFGNESRGDGTPDASTSTNRRSGNPLFDAETLRTPTSGRRPEIDGIGRPGWRRSSTEQHREYRRADDLHGGETAAFSTADGERNNAHRGGGGRITFPSISRKVGSVNSTGSRQSSSFHVASRAGPSGGGEGFQHGEDQDESLYEDDTRVRLLGGFYHRSGPRQQASLSVRNGARGSDGIREDTQLLSAGDPVPHASAAIAAALASASVAASGASAATTATTSRSSAFSPTTSDTLVAAPSRSPPHLFDSTGNPAASWEAGADEGGGHGIVADAGGNSTSGSIIGRSSGRSTGSAHGGGRGNDGGGGGGGGDDDEESRSGTPRNTQTTTPTSTAAGRANGIAIAAARSGGRAQQELEARGGFESGDAPYANIPIPILGPRNSGSGRGGVAGGMRYGGGYDGGLTEEAQASNEHVGLIRALWLQEKESRLASEAKAEAVRDQSARLWNELVRSEKQVLSLEEGAASLREERDKLKATLSGDGFKGRCLPELEQLEKDLRKALEGVCAERERIVQERLAKEEQRLCVVCQENERGVLLLPCRHLCVCKGCSERRELTLCPLCRNHIAETLVVYS